MFIVCAFIPRMAETAKWNGRLYLAGEAWRFLLDRMVLIMAGILPPVALYTAATESTTELGGSYERSHRAILSEIYRAVLG